jgi:hypothetical protein
MFRFTLRDIFWLTLAVGLGFGWWLDHRHLQRRRAIEKEQVLQEAADIIHEATNGFGY